MLHSALHPKQESQDRGEQLGCKSRVASETVKPALCQHDNIDGARLKSIVRSIKALQNHLHLPVQHLDTLLVPKR